MEKEIKRLDEIVKQKKVEEIDLAFPLSDIEATQKIIDGLSEKGLQILGFFGDVLTPAVINDVNAETNYRKRMDKLESFFKLKIDNNLKKKHELGDEINDVSEIVRRTVTIGRDMGLNVAAKSVADYARSRLYPPTVEMEE